MEREISDGNGAGHVPRDGNLDLADEAPGLQRDAAPDYLAPIDVAAPVSGHVPPPDRAASPVESPEQDWAAASAVVFPALRPVGTSGIRVDGIDREVLAAQGSRNHAQPLVDEGPCELAVVYALRAEGFDVIVNADHLLTWGIEPAEIQDAALRNLAAWSATAGWASEVSGARRLLSSDSGGGWDASRILLPEARDHIATELGGEGRILIGLPERHLLVAGSLAPDDPEFASLFGDFIAEQAGAADEPIDRRVFELVDGRLVEFAPAPA